MMDAATACSAFEHAQATLALNVPPVDMDRFCPRIPTERYSFGPGRDRRAQRHAQHVQGPYDCPNGPELREKFFQPDFKELYRRGELVSIFNGRILPAPLGFT
ncbi:MAG: hypothetical protein C4519_16750 [Desulfobacteraceae bacterium]|nr:MAG: hypothetical protein C4519_16750 [Desulfobacteraceae bacterium]